MKNRLRELRTARSWSQQELGARVGVSRQAIIAIETGRYDADTLIETSPGALRVGSKTIQDKHNLGTIDVTTVLAKSSNVGVVKIALTLKPEEMWSGFDHFGFGHVTGSGYPGESAGLVPGHQHWRPIGQATMSYGYGLSVTAQVPIEHAPNPHNEAYLRAKRDRLGHTLHHQGLALDEQMVHEEQVHDRERRAG